MTILLYDLCGAEDRRFSPYCWRTRMALAHKGLAVETRSTPFTGIARIAGGGQKTVPVIEDNGRAVADSWDIAVYLEESYTDRSSLFGGPGGMALAKFVESWAFTALHSQLSPLIAKDIHDRLLPEDQAYFRETREKRFGDRLENLQAGREQRLERLHAVLAPLSATLAKQPFLGGAAPLYADYIVFGSLQWARVISPFQVIPAPGVPVSGWFERCLDLFDGLGRCMPSAA
jgi:glutathione S-transferase